MASNPFAAFGNDYGRSASASVDYQAIMPEVATRLLGKPSYQTKTELRFGKKGSLSVDLENGRYYSHEDNAGGGVLDLIMRERHCDAAAALSWLEEAGLKDREASRPSSPRSEPAGSIFYDYVEDGVIQFRVERRGKGHTPPFLQYAPDGKGGFFTGKDCMQGVRRCLYYADKLAGSPKSEIVYFCEGEKDVDRLVSLGLIATTNPGGAGKVAGVRDSIGRHLAGRSVVVLEDNDVAGADHAAKVIEALVGVADRAAILKLKGLPPKGDVSDWLDAGGSVEDLKRLAAKALEQPAETLPLADLRLWSVTQATPKAFVMAGFVPAGELTLATGAGGSNKSTFGQQLATCCAAGLPMLGIDVQQQAALYVTAEDDENRLHWMQEHICKTVGVRLADLEGKLHLSSLRGYLGNEFATFDAEGRLHPTKAFQALRSTIRQTGARLIVLDNSAHFFAGNENDRQQVTAFVNLLYSLCLDMGATVILVAHANKAGDSYSGSTAWLNAVRSQIVLTRPENSHDPDERVLTLGKANYARQGEELRFRWHDFALVRDEDLPDDKRAELAAISVANAENTAFLACLRARADQGEGRLVGPSPGPNYAPSQFEGMAEAKGMKKQVLKRAMDRLFAIGAIESYTYRNTTKARDVTVIREAEKSPRTLPRTLPEHSSRSTPNAVPNDPAHTPYTTYSSGAAFGAAAPYTNGSSDLSVVDFPAEDCGLDSGGDVLGWNDDRRPRF